MKKINKYFYIIMIIAFYLQGCEREIEQDIISDTPPELHVYVENAGGERVANAAVIIYDTEENLNSGTNPIVTKTTDANGIAITTGTELGTTGIFYVRAEGSNQTGTGATPFLLLNDGHTRFDVVIE